MPTSVCVYLIVIVLYDISFAVEFESAPQPFKLNDKPTPVKALHGHYWGYCPNDNKINSFQEIEVTNIYGDEDNVLIGGQGAVLFVDVNEGNINDTKLTMTEEFQLDPSQNAGVPCSGLVKDVEQCQNYITVIQPLNNISAIVCGTNGLFPQCYSCIIIDNTTSLSCGENSGYPTQDSGVVAHRPMQHAAWLYVPDVGEQGTVFAGGNEKYDQNSVISRVAVNTDVALDLDNVIKTDSDDPDWLNNAEFVGDPIDYGDHIYFFFRETATEYINAGKIVYSRVGRVCKNDMGGGVGSILDGKFTTYQKARLNCSTQGNFPFYFNELQDIYQSSDETNPEIIYATFSTPHTEATGSALCVFRLDEINDLFNEGKFKGQANPSSLWLPKDESSVSKQLRPGNCSSNQPSTSYSFIKSYPLMNPLVPNTRTYRSKRSYLHQSSSALGIITGIRIVELVVDEQVPDANGTKHDIFFLASANGIIYKGYLEKEDLFVIFEEYDLNLIADERVITIKLKDGTLYVGTSECVHLLRVEHCNLYNKCYECLQAQDPYCSWNMQNNQCQYSPNVGEAIQCLRKTELQEAYQCDNTCDWPRPKVAFCSDDQTFVFNKPLNISFYFTATALPNSNLDYTFTCTCDNATDCTNIFKPTRSSSVNRNPSAVQWISVAVVADKWDAQCPATVEFMAIANGQNVTRTREIKIDNSVMIMTETEIMDYAWFDEQMADYLHNVSLYRERVIGECYSADEITTCKGTAKP